MHDNGETERERVCVCETEHGGSVGCKIVNYDSSVVNKFGASLTDDARVIIYDRHMFIVQAIGLMPQHLP